METERSLSTAVVSLAGYSKVELNTEERIICESLEALNYGVYIEQIREYLERKKHLERTSRQVYFAVRNLTVKGFIRKEERSRGFIYFLESENWSNFLRNRN